MGGSKDGRVMGGFTQTNQTIYKVLLSFGRSPALSGCLLNIYR